MTMTTGTKWQPVELIGWTRRAYGRRIMLESEGGTLTTRMGKQGRPQQLSLRCEVTGRILLQVFCNGQPVRDELVSHGTHDSVLDLEAYRTDDELEVEVHLIPATFAEVRIEQQIHATGGELHRRAS